eukprot:5519804-Amphidinium_carterae.1
MASIYVCGAWFRMLKRFGRTRGKPAVGEFADRASAVSQNKQLILQTQAIRPTWLVFLSRRMQCHIL